MNILYGHMDFEILSKISYKYRGLFLRMVRVSGYKAPTAHFVFTDPGSVFMARWDERDVYMI